ncbi:hypothetical protein PENTCL1PPCAC_6966, partial [Pristionchus entomophagus]
ASFPLPSLIQIITMLHQHLILILISIAVFANTAEIDCTGKINKCLNEEPEGCDEIFPPQQDLKPSELCGHPAVHNFAVKCRQTCQSCCNLPCGDTNANCAKWKDQDFCTISDTRPLEQILLYCNKTCGMCE